MGEGQKTVGRYVIDCELGRGGMGVVYKAHDTERNIDVAIKTIPPELAHHPEFLQRFQQEARALMRLHHPHIVSLIDLLQDQGNHYMVLEYVDGPSLSQLLAKGPLPPERASEIALQVAGALSYSHAHNIVHRDIKTSNILLTKEGLVKVTDFGIARILDATLGTLTGKVFGTARYASPEQVKGLKVDHRSDLYSLGVVLYEMLAGRPPFLGTDDELMEQHIRAEPVPPSRLNEQVPAFLETVTLRCLEKDRDSRYQRAEDLAANLRRAKVGTKPGVGEKPKGGRDKRQPIVAFAAITAILVVALVALAVVIWPRLRGGRARTIASDVGDATPAHQPSPTGADTDAPAYAAETQPPAATPTEVTIMPTATPFVGQIAFLSDRDHQDVEAVNSWRPVELYLMNPDGSDQRRLTSDDAPLSEVGAGGKYMEVRRVAWQPATESVLVLLSAVPDVAAFFRSSDGQLERTLELSSDVGGQTIDAELLDSSPDGSRVVFTGIPAYTTAGDSEHLLWVANSDGSDWRPLIETGTNMRPVWSPDGLRIAFTRSKPSDEAGLYVVGSDGTGLHLVATGADWIWKAWSPDGTQIAAEVWEGHDIVLVDVSTGNTINLTATPDRDEIHPSWSPDGSQIAYQVGWGSTGEIWVINADGSGAHKIAEGCCPAWQPAPQVETHATNNTPPSEPAGTPKPVAATEPTSGRIAFVSDRDGNNEVYVMDPDGSNQTNLTNHRTDDGMPCWLPDGKRVAFMGTRDSSCNLYLMSVEGSEVTRLTHDQGYEGWPSWSPDGSRVAFVSDDSQIHIMNADGTDQYRLTNSVGGTSRACWSSDGTKLAIAVDTDGHMHYQIYLIKADGSDLTCLSDGSGSDQLPCWSPDGTRIAFASNRDGNMDIYTMHADGGGVTRLTDHPSPDWAPCWSPDGRRIAFTTSRDGNEEVYVMNEDGTEQVNLTDNPAWDGLPSWSPR
jgi:Tol biopolymer transport system component